MISCLALYRQEGRRESPLKRKDGVRMNLESLLSEKRSLIIKKWRNTIVDTYPEETRRFFKKEKDQFSNPVGNIIDSQVGTLYDELIKGEDIGKISACLDKIIRIRAVQDFKPSHAIGFVLELKRIIREALGSKVSLNGLFAELELLEDRIDKTSLLAFDIYSQCRQKIYEIRVNEVKNHVGKLLERANLTVEIPE